MTVNEEEIEIFAMAIVDLYYHCKTNIIIYYNNISSCKSIKD